ncbi:uncharacterized protein [Triticum aestivum]|uniref:uncharacterized protein n=1 Tax=Triticum aestivum TaxID=4565 RepID=UPI001D022E14|nr:uncharacterized protein LOC123074908 [Triticum aestivum]
MADPGAHGKSLAMAASSLRLLHGRTWEREHERERQQEKKGKGRRGASVAVLLVAASRTARWGRRQGARGEARDLEKGHGMEELGRVLLSLDQTREAAGALGVEVGDGLVRWGKRGKERGWIWRDPAAASISHLGIHLHPIQPPPPFPCPTNLLWP